MGNLLLNENMKLYRRARTWVMLAFMVAAVCFGSLMEWHENDLKKHDGSWREYTEYQKQIYTELANRQKVSEENKAYFEKQVAVYDYHLEHNIPPEEGTMWDAVNSSAELIILITILTVIVAGDSLAGEFSGGTIKLLLIRPASRLSILIAKYLSMMMFGLLLLVILFAVSIMVNGLLYGFGQLDLPLVTTDATGQVVEKNMVANLWKTYMFNGISTIMLVTMALMISAAFRSSTMAIGISLSLLFAGVILTELLHPFAWSKYMLFANMDLTQYLSGAPYQDGMTLSFSIAVLMVHFLLFNLVTWLSFTRRDVTA